MEILEPLKKFEFSVEPDDLKTFGKDWTKVYEPNPSIVLFPKTTLEVSEILKYCFAKNIAVVPSGGRTGLAGGAVAQNGEAVLSFEKMRQMGAVDSMAQTLWVQAGAVTEQVHEHCKPHGLTWPVDFASKGSSHVGGNIATNAGGVKVIRYGLTRNWVLGLTVVLMDGTVLELNGALEKNNTGIDLRQIFIGTEGILGVITEAILKLAPMPGPSDVFLFGVENLNSVFDLFLNVRNSGFMVNAFECFSHECLQVVLNHRQHFSELEVKSPLQGQHSQYVLLEVERPAETDAQTKLDSWLASLFEEQNGKTLVEDAVLAQSPREAAHLWSLREGISESLSATGLLHKHDISLPIDELKAFLENWSKDLEQNYPGLKPYIFGHIGDGNLHINLMKPEAMPVPEFRSLCARADENMFGWIQKYRGSVSAEHGIGLLKKHLLKYSRTDAEIRLMKSMKAMLDPKMLLNPGKILS